MWKYDKTQYSKEDDDFPLIPEGMYLVKILEVIDKISKSGKDMRVLKLKPINEDGMLYYYLTYDPDKRHMTNQFLGRIFDSFNIPEGQQDRVYWLQQIGAAEVIHEEYNGRIQAKIKKFLTQEKQKELGLVVPPSKVEEDVLDLTDDDEIPF